MSSVLGAVAIRHCGCPNGLAGGVWSPPTDWNCRPMRFAGAGLVAALRRGFGMCWSALSGMVFAGCGCGATDSGRGGTDRPAIGGEQRWLADHVIAGVVLCSPVRLFVKWRCVAHQVTVR